MNKDKVFLILGASSDLGIALIKKLNEEYSGSTFVLHYHSNDEKLKEMSFIRSNKAVFIQGDLSSRKGTAAFIDALKEKEIEPTHIVHLPASKMMFTKLKEFDTSRTEKNAQIQVYSFVEIMKAFLPGMAKKKDHCKVVAVVSSVVNGKPPKFMLEYTMVKSMLLGAVKQLAADYEGKMVNINAVSPSMIETKFLSEIDPRVIEMAATGSPEGRHAKVTEIVPAIAFLLSEESNYISGANLNVSNGSVII